MNGKMLADVLIIEAILLFIGRCFGWEGFVMVLLLEIWFTFGWISNHMK